MNILVIEPETQRANSISSGLAARGFPVRHTGDPFFALTLAERGDIDLIFVSGKIEGLNAFEFTRIIQQDASLSRTTVVLYDLEPSDLRVLPPRTHHIRHSDDGQLIGGMAANISAMHERHSSSFSSRGWNALTTKGVSMIGTFEVTTLPDLLQMVCSSEDYGEIVISTSFGPAAVKFGPEKIYDIQYRDLKYLDALTLLVDDIDHQRGAQFRVRKSREDGAESARKADAWSGHKPSHLLMEVAVRLDEQRRGVEQDRPRQRS